MSGGRGGVGKSVSFHCKVKITLFFLTKIEEQNEIPVAFFTDH
jgi:hypothetical protein